MAERYMQMTRRDWIVALFIILLAFTYRVIIIVDRAQAPNEISAFDPLPTGSDQRTYYSSIQEFRDGAFPPSTYHYQPAPSWFMIAGSTLMRTDNPGALRVLVAALASINCGIMIRVARLAFGKRWLSYLAGLLLALYPVGAFYDTDFVITSQATILVTLALFGVLWLWRQPTNWTGTVIFGVGTGIIILMRRELALIAPILGLWLLWQHRRVRTVLQGGMAAIIAIMLIVPIALHNRAGGADYLITPVGMTEMYRGNNRDADGTYGGKQASQTTTGDFLNNLWRDIQLSPRRFIELEMHKIGLYFSSSEPGNNLNFVVSGHDISPALAINPLRFSPLLALFLLGLWTAFRKREPTSILFGLVFLVMMGSTLLIWVEARIRTPVIAVMIPVAAYGVVSAIEAFRRWQAAQPRQISRGGLLTWGAPLAVIVGVVIFSTWAEHDLPQVVTVDRLPDTAQPTGAIYEDTLELVGYHIQEGYSRAGIIRPFEPYVVSFYWRVLKPTTTDYSFALGEYIDGERVISFDHPIGVVGYPENPTSAWPPDTIYVEHVGMAYKQFEGPTMVSGDLLLNVYAEREAETLLPAAGLEGDPTFIRLAQPAIMVGEGRFDTLEADGDILLFGDVLLLEAWDFPATASAGETISVRLGWQTTDQPIERSYAFGVYLFSADGEFIGQADGILRDGRLLTTSLPTNFRLEDVKSLTLPGTPGVYMLYAGIYDLETNERLTVPGTSDNLARLGEIEVR